MEHDLQEKIPQLIPQIVEIPARNGVGHLVRFPPSGRGGG
jgi:hypothetical protein